jgi:cysteine-rich repeat protein
VKSYPAQCAVQPTATPTPTRTPTPTPTVTPPAGPVQIKCERAIVKESGRLLGTRVKALVACAADKQKGKLPSDADCLTATGAGATIDKAETKFLTKVAKACGGANRECNVQDAGADADLAPAAFGWGPGECPGFENADCHAPIVDCNDVAGCIACVQHAGVEEALALLIPVDVPNDPDAATCQAAVGRAATGLFLARAAALRRCADVTLVQGPGASCAKSDAAIAKAGVKFVATLCRSCGGADRACGGGDDVAPTAIGFPAQCPAVGTTGASCAAPVTTLDELAACVQCVSGFKSECLDQIAIPDLRGYDDGCRPPTPTPAGPTPTAPTPSPTPQGVCGNHVVEPGEDCDDGNTESCDDCPGNCRFAPVACPTAGRQTQQVRLTRSDGQSLSSALFCLQYPVGTVALPGTGLVTQRVSGFQGLTTVNDFNDAAKIGLVGQQQLTQITMTVSLDLCTGATPPPATDFACAMISASNGGASVDPSTVDCTPVAP